MGQATVRFTRKTKAFLLAGALCLLGTLVVLALSATPQPRNWQTGTRQVASFEGWYPSLTNPFYHWLSNSEILCIESEFIPSTRHVLKKRNIRTGAVSPVATLPQQFISHLFNSIQLSPDENYLLWWYTSPKQTQTVWTLELRNTHTPNRVRTWAIFQGSYDPPRWLPDSSGWFDSQNRKYMVNRAKVRKSIDYPIDLFHNAILLGELSDGDWIVCRYPSNATIGTSGRELVRLVPPSNTRPGSPREIKSDITRSNASIYISPLALSPEETEILWFERRLRNPWQAYADNWLSVRGWHLPWAHWDTGKETVLFTSNLQGAYQRELGILPDEMQGFDPDSVQWTPDGKHISFVYDSALYVRSIH